MLRNGFVYILNEWSLMLGEKKYILFLRQLHYIFYFAHLQADRSSNKTLHNAMIIWLKYK